MNNILSIIFPFLSGNHVLQILFHLTVAQRANCRGIFKRDKLFLDHIHGLFPFFLRVGSLQFFAKFFCFNEEIVERMLLLLVSKR